MYPDAKCNSWAPGRSSYQRAGKGGEKATEGSSASQTHLHAGVDHGHKYHQRQQQETGQVETQHEHGAGRREEVGNSGGSESLWKAGEMAPSP